MNETEIEYLDCTWNPIAMRCTPVSPGCAHCWHLRMADRLAGNPVFSDEVRAAYAGEADPLLVSSRYHQPDARSKPAIVGVQFMGDLFHEDVSDEDILDVLIACGAAGRHTFLLLTKRPRRMLRWWRDVVHSCELPPNVWLGVSVEDQDYTFRVELLRETSARVRFLSLEPLLGPLPRLSLDGIDWVLVGGESGPDARPLDPEWAISLKRRCERAGVPFFFKQGSAANWDRYRDLDSFPAELRVRQFPNAGVAQSEERSITGAQ